MARSLNKEAIWKLKRGHLSVVITVCIHDELACTAELRIVPESVHFVAAAFSDGLSMFFFSWGYLEVFENWITQVGLKGNLISILANCPLTYLELDNYDYYI